MLVNILIFLGFFVVFLLSLLVRDQLKQRSGVDKAQGAAHERAQSDGGPGSE